MASQLAESQPGPSPLGYESDAGPAEREITFDEALSIVVLLQQQNRMEDAEKLCRVILEGQPGHPDGLHFLALSIHRRGGYAEAVGILEGVLARYPEHADAWSNLGIFHKTAGENDQAATAFEHAIALDRTHVNAWSNLGLARRAQGQLEAAEAAYRQALALCPTHAAAWHNLAVLLENRGAIPEAVDAFNRACIHDPANADSKRMLAHAYSSIGENDKAAEVLQSWLAEQPGHPIATHLLAACSGTNIPGRASDACVEQMFDSFASTFDTKLRNLRYQAPELVQSILADHLPPPDRSLAIADAGCGTGLCGPLLAPFASRLTGVDLSAGMLNRAKERKVYDELVKSELTAFFASRPRTFDVIVSADTLVYFGDLSDALSAMAGALKGNGLVAFTLERAPGNPSAGYLLEANGRYAHTEAYVRRELTALDLTVQLIEVELRMESGRPVNGLLVWATSAPNSSS